MKNITNSYFKAILRVTVNGRFPEYADCWRSYHLTSLMIDSDHFFATTKPIKNLAGRIERRA